MTPTALALLGWSSSALAGDLVGRVVDENGEPAANVLVLSYDQRLSYGSSTTNAAGQFALRGLPRNPYRLRLLPPAGLNVVERYYPNGGFLCDAEVTVLKRSNEVDLGDVVLPFGGVAQGRLLDANSQPIVSAEVIARPTGPISGVLNRSGTTGEDGWFEVVGIPLVLDGTAWRIEIEDTNMPHQFLGRVYEEELGEIWEIAPDVTAQLGEHVLLEGGSFSGTVVGLAAGTEATVYAYTIGRVQSTVTVGGAWEIAGLTPGEATLWAEAEGRANTWYGDADRPTLGPTVEDDVRVDGIELALLAEAHLVGRLNVDNADGMSVAAVNDDGTVSVTATVNDDGTFDVGRLAGGDYSLQIYPRDDQDLLEGSLLDEHDIPRLFSVPAGGTGDAGVIEVPVGARIQGVVRDRYTQKPVYGAWVYIQDVGADITRLVVAESDGSYELGGLAVGTYKVWSEYQHYCDDDVDWVVRYYPDQVNPALGGSIALAPGQVLEWNVGMAPDADHDAMDDEWEILYRLDPRVDDSAEDPDDDGFTNLEEYLFDTDPTSQAGAGCGCQGQGAAWILLALPLGLFRRNVVNTVSPATYSSKTKNTSS
ncbi:MAG: hypothetical protein GWP91_21705 [Rhodobacterales bacterium]|nr:hypothetical protein [Rhodobacterales bacterium]